jgi:hypothetical protein
MEDFVSIGSDILQPPVLENSPSKNGKQQNHQLKKTSLDM